MKLCRFALLTVVLVMTSVAVCYKRLKELERRKADRERKMEKPVDMPDNDDSLVSLKDNDGNDVSFEFLDMIEFAGDNYVVLRPCSPEGDTVVILKEVAISSADSECDEYETVDDQDVLDAVFAIFKYKFRDEFIFPV